MRTSQAGISLIKEFEGLRLKAYRCPAGLWTIGYGHTTAAGKPVVFPDMTITEQEAERILARDLEMYEDGVKRAVKVDLTQNQFDVLVSFAYNCGVGALEKSTLLKRVNAGRFADVPAELMKWTKSGGKELAGLVRRRRAEAKLWRGLDKIQAEPEEGRVSPDMPKPSKSMARSKEGNAALVAGGLSAVTLAKEVADGAQTASDALTTVMGLHPTILVLAAICVIAAAIWWWRKERLDEEGA